MRKKGYYFYCVIAHSGNLWFTCLDYIFPSTIGITDNDKAVEFSFHGVAHQVCKTVWKPQESELARNSDSWPSEKHGTLVKFAPDPHQHTETKK